MRQTELDGGLVVYNCLKYIYLDFCVIFQALLVSDCKGLKSLRTWRECAIVQIAAVKSFHCRKCISVVSLPRGFSYCFLCQLHLASSLLWMISTGLQGHMGMLSKIDIGRLELLEYLTSVRMWVFTMLCILLCNFIIANSKLIWDPLVSIIWDITFVSCSPLSLHVSKPCL